MTDLGPRAVSALGFVCLLAVAWALSENRARIAWRTVGIGVALQFALGVVLLATPVGGAFFRGMTSAVSVLTRVTDVGSRFVFGALADSGFSIVVNVLPIIIFMGSFLAVLYHLGVVQRVVDAFAWALSRTLRVSGAESLAAVSNLFVGMTESALVVRPYLERMTRSELFSLMTLGMATVAGSVMLAYVGMLGPEYAGHLATASLLSAPAGLVVAKMMVPETEVAETGDGRHAVVEASSVNVVDAAAQGALAGLRIAAYVGAMLLAFRALIELVNEGLFALGRVVGVDGLSLEQILGVLLAPLAWILGVPAQDAVTVGSLLGVKTVLNEFLAYQQLSALLEAGTLAPRSVLIASYALCGFANFGSLAILFGGIGGLAPGRRSEIARFGLASIVSGSLATFMTAAVAGIVG
jgi:CNT family concentrative nucleoside transporter